jgi:hypothetical protein
MDQIVRFGMDEMCHGQNRPFQHGCNVLWSKSSVLACLEMSKPKLSILAWLECVIVKNRQFQNVWKTGKCHGQNHQFQHG